MWNCIKWTQVALGATCQPEPSCNAEGREMSASWDQRPPIYRRALLQLEAINFVTILICSCTVFKIYITDLRGKKQNNITQPKPSLSQQAMGN